MAEKQGGISILREPLVVQEILLPLHHERRFFTIDFAEYLFDRTMALKHLAQLVGAGCLVEGIDSVRLRACENVFFREQAL